MQNKKTIFISYGRDQKNPEDVEMVRKIKNDLEKEGFNILMDEEQLRTTNDWAVELERMILDSQWVLYFITPYSARRPDGFCLRELTHSLVHGVPIAPVMIRQEVLPIEICRIQYLDLQALKNEEEYQKKLAEIITVLNGTKELRFEGEHIRILKELEPIKFETIITKHIHNFVGREWVYEEVDRWLEEDSRVLWLQAEAGFGKSAIATYLAKSHPSALSIHFCQYDYRESKDPREMLKVLIYELSTQIDEYHKILQTLPIKDALSKSTEHIFTQLLLEPLQQISKPEKKLFFVIDALDEGVADGKNEIVELISNRFFDLPSWLNIVITSRPEPELMRKLKKFNPIELKANDKRNREDLEIYLSENKKIEDEKMQKALIDKSEGNMLYLKSIFELEMIKEGEFTLENIEKLPDSMDGFYLTYFERKFEDIDEYEEKYLEFVSLLVVQEGLPEILVKDVLGLDERSYHKIKARFGSLLEVEDKNLTFYHKSIYEWLSDYNKSGDYSADIKAGGEKYDDFVDALDAESYKEEYLELFGLNLELIESIHKKEGNLNFFRKLVEATNNTKKIIDFANNLYDYSRGMDRIVDRLEELYTISDFDSSELDHSMVIEPILLVVIKLKKEILDIRKLIYEINPNATQEVYIKALNDLSKSYIYANEFDSALISLKEQYEIFLSIYGKNSTKVQKVLNDIKYVEKMGRQFFRRGEGK